MDIEDLRLAVYRGFRRSGTPPTQADLAHELHATDVEVREGLDELARGRHLVLSEGGDIMMAHPFSAVPLGFSVMGQATLWWGGCSWDSFALAHLLDDEPDVLVASRCPGCGLPGAWVVGRDGPPRGDWLAHFLVPVSDMWQDVLHTCANQRLFCSETCLETWLADKGYEKGYVMELEMLWRLAGKWYDGRLTRGYQRREPAEAADYFRAVGLAGPFWGI
jgi:hypothetical protein